MSLAGKVVAFTGTLAMPRKEAAALAEGAGAKVASSVTGATDFLVCGSGVGSKKTEEAERKGVKVWTEDEFTAAAASVGGAAPAKKAAAKKLAAGQPEEEPAAKKRAVDEEEDDEEEEDEEEEEEEEVVKEEER